MGKLEGKLFSCSVDPSKFPKRDSGQWPRKQKQADRLARSSPRPTDRAGQLADGDGQG